MKGLNAIVDHLGSDEFVARHGRNWFLFALASQFVFLPCAAAAYVAANAPSYPHPIWQSGFLWFAIAFAGNWLLGVGFSLGVLFVTWAIV